MTNKEVFADIRNKLTAPLVVLEMLSNGREVPLDFIRDAKADLEKAGRLLGTLIE